MIDNYSFQNIIMTMLVNDVMYTTNRNKIKPHHLGFNCNSCIEYLSSIGGPHHHHQVFGIAAAMVPCAPLDI